MSPSNTDLDCIPKQHDHSNHDKANKTACPSQMIFHGGNCEAILFSSWTVREAKAFMAVAFVIFLVAVLYEGLKYYQDKLLIDAQMAEDKEENDQGEGRRVKSIQERIFSKQHVIQTAVHMLQVAESYLLMLIVMTYNVWLFLAVVIGAATGFFCFGWLRTLNR